MNSGQGNTNTVSLQNQEVIRQDAAPPETEPNVKEQVKNLMGTVIKKANTVEYPKEGSPSQVHKEKPTSYFITPNLAYELVKIS